jgi:hypothetical protein
MTPAEAWASVVAGEDAAIYAYSVAGARVPAADRRRARAAMDAHRERRARASALVSAAGGTPPPPGAAYALPEEVARPRIAARLLAEVDNALVAVYADAAGASIGSDRRWAARCAADCAASAVAWGATPQAFPQSTA